jgi:hypothetical protein
VAKAIASKLVPPTERRVEPVPSPTPTEPPGARASRWIEETLGAFDDMLWVVRQVYEQERAKGGPPGLFFTTVHKTLERALKARMEWPYK